MIELRINRLTVTTYLELRASVGWKALSINQANKALKNSLYIICAYCDNKPVGMGRLVGDGAVICYVQDLIVIPEMQNQHVGSKILEALIAEVKTYHIDDTTMMLCLMCAKGREAFYEAHGFNARPNNQLGPGMIQYIE